MHLDNYYIFEDTDILYFPVSRMEDTAQSTVSVGNVRGGYKKSKELWIR